MHKGYMVTVFFITLINSSFAFNDKCHFICYTDGCEVATNNLNSNISSIKFCTSEDVSTDVNFSLIENENKTTFPAVVQIELKPPKNVCKYELILFANELINEKKCMNYRFNYSNVRMVHSRSIICFVSNDEEYKEKSLILVPYIFTACYSIQFIFGKDIKMIKRNEFLKSNYKKTEVTQPTFECTYNIASASETNKKQLDFWMDLSVPIFTVVMIQLKVLHRVGEQEICSMANDFPNGVWNFNALNNYIGDDHHNLSTTLLTNEQYRQRWKFSTEISQETSYCAIISLQDDIKCKQFTLWWNPPPICYWYKNCQNTTPYENFVMQANTNYDTVSYEPIIIITLSVFAFIGIMYLIYIIRVYKVHEKNFYINICSGNIVKTNQTKCYKSNVCTSEDNKKKAKCKEHNITNTDIILLYHKGPESFMTLMADFRGVLSRICRCVVHDWYNGMEWNYVAKIGPSDWFAEMFRKECSVVWIDTPMMRSLITQRFKKNSFSKNSEEYSLVKIGDFRDVVLPTVYDFAKRNIERSTLNEPKHFIVRLKGFENFESDEDPFVDLSAHTRYLIPRDLKLLHSDLSVLESDVNVPFASQEDLIEQHLHDVKFDFYK